MILIFILLVSHNQAQNTNQTLKIENPKEKIHLIFNKINKNSVM